MNKNKHIKIYETLYSRIIQGEYTGKLPNEHVLANEFEVNFKTVAKALKSLDKDGIITRQRGQGSFVIGHSEQPLRPFIHVTQNNINVFDVDNPYYPNVSLFINCLWHEAGKRNIPVSLLPTGFLDKYLETHAYNGIYGNYLITYGAGFEATTIQNLVDKGYKPIFIGVDREFFPDLRSIPFMAIDSKMELRYQVLLSHLRATGKRRPGLVYLEVDKGKDRYQIFADQVKSLHLDFAVQRTVASSDFDCEDAIRELLSRDTDMDSVIVPHNRAARLFKEELSKLNRKIPDDITITAINSNYTDINNNASCREFTYTELPVAEMARTAVEIAFKQTYTPGTIYIPSQLHIQNETKQP